MQKIEDQDTTDFDKSLKFIVESASEVKNIVALNCFGGRLDHTMAILNSCYVFESLNDLKIQLMNESCLARAIYDKEVSIKFPNFKGSNCGILPLFGPVNLETNGLQWNLSPSQTVQFSGLISTSNRVISSEVSIKNSSNIPYVWTHEIKY